ncbi:hypothetical protein [Xylocopilactobacillus apis]|uniref:Uncharacterized protein n=1 Tax=Xylocopilactobacillus apis TaxID=2932183 RepID=A0AAU9DF62_9LACO|nr:hypothetical protein [Xylocopilactobacillus apis]BDR56866.1 hypothetical protein KIMC2_14280 [Xylocopilactobacillus apis]
MSIKNDDGFRVSYDANDLIADILEDIDMGIEYVIAYYDWVKGIKIYKDYDLFHPAQETIDDPDFQEMAKGFDGKDHLTAQFFLLYLIRENEAF